MGNTLIDTFGGFLTPDLVARTASVTGESSSSISKAISAAGTLVLGGLVEKVDEPGKMSQIMSLLTSPNATNALGNLNSLVAAGLVTAGPAKSPVMEAGSNFLSSIFGSRQGAVTDALSQYAGIKSTSASSLLGWVAPISMGLLGDRVRGDGLSVASLSNWLASQRGQLTSLPTTLLSAAGLGGLREPVDHRVAPARVATVEPRRSMRWLWPALIARDPPLGLSPCCRGPDRSTSGLPRSTSWSLRAKRREMSRAPPTERWTLLVGRPPISARSSLAGCRTASPSTSRSAASRTRSSPFIEDAGQPLEPARWFNFDRLLLRNQLGDSRAPVARAAHEHRRDHEGLSVGASQDRRLHRQHRGVSKPT